MVQLFVLFFFVVGCEIRVAREDDDLLAKVPIALLWPDIILQNWSCSREEGSLVGVPEHPTHIGCQQAGQDNLKITQLAGA